MIKTNLTKFLLIALIFNLSMPLNGFAQDNAPSAPLDAVDELLVVSSKSDIFKVPGSASFLDKEDLAAHNYMDIQRMLQQVPGINFQEEDGLGLRPNIGLRGAQTERNGKITVMEDGILIAPAAYASPSAYYFPRATRMESIEIVKGPAAIKYGPRTVGGSINMISTRIPEEFGGTLKARFGTDAQSIVHLTMGGTSGKWGFLVETLQEEGDGFKSISSGTDVGYEIESYVAKLRYQDVIMGVEQSFQIKAEWTDENSNETYLGLTEADYNLNPYSRYAASQLDNMDNEHLQGVFTHVAKFSENTTLTTAIYNTETARNWYKLDKIGSAKISSLLKDPASYPTQMLSAKGGVCSSDDCAWKVKANNREYFTKGFQMTLRTSIVTGSATHDIEVGFREHEDEMDRFQFADYYHVNASGNPTKVKPGAPGSDSNRLEQAEATSMYISDQITIGKTSVLLGLRMEDIESRRVDYGKSDPSRATDPKISGVSYDEVMPSVGVTYQVNDTLQILAGLYKGFSPTSVKSDIFEESTNSEFGFRYIGSGFSLSAIAFLSDYENLTGTCTASTGCAGDIGDSFSAGEAEVSGLEVSAAWLVDLGSIQAPVSIAYTYQETEFSDSFKSGYGLWGEVESGDEFAYMPENVLNINVGLRAANWGMDATLNFKDKMRTSGGSGYDPYQIEDRTLIDLSGYYSTTPEIDLTINIQNLFDEEYSVSWHPAGKRPGKPQTVLVGIRAAF